MTITPKLSKNRRGPFPQPQCTSDTLVEQVENRASMAIVFSDDQTVRYSRKQHVRVYQTLMYMYLYVWYIFIVPVIALISQASMPGPIRITDRHPSVILISHVQSFSTRAEGDTRGSIQIFVAGCIPSADDGLPSTVLLFI